MRRSRSSTHRRTDPGVPAPFATPASLHDDIAHVPPLAAWALLGISAPHAMTAPAQYDVIVIGGGPAGSTVGRLLARWGHRVLVLTRPRDPQRGLAESIPPSARKLLSAIGVLDAVERGGFPRNRGNAVWWGESAGRDESFDGEGHDTGFQVFRPDFDALLLGEAFAAGADVRRWATVRAVTFPSSSTRPMKCSVSHMGHSHGACPSSATDSAVASIQRPNSCIDT